MAPAAPHKKLSAFSYDIITVENMKENGKQPSYTRR